MIRALAAHALAMVAIVTAVFLAMAINGVRGAETTRSLREAAASLVLRSAAMSAQSAWVPSGSEIVVPFMSVLGSIAIATILVPWATAGERPASTWFRCIKATLWGAWALVPAVLVLATYVALWMKPVSSEIDWGAVVSALIGFLQPQPEDWSREQTIVAVNGGVGAIWFLYSVWLAVRPVGDRAGREFERLEPRCEQCGYVIVGLPLDGQCPECSASIRDSVPGGRRVESEWERDRRRPRGIIALFKTHARIVRSAEFFRTLRARQDLAAARHFWWTTYLLLIAPGIAIWATARIAASANRDSAEFWGAFAGVLAFPFVVQCGFMLAACVRARWSYGIDDLRLSSAVVLYSCPLLWFSILVVPALVVLTDDVRSLSPRVNALCASASVDPETIYLVGFELLVLFWLIFCWLRICRGLRFVRYANS